MVDFKKFLNGAVVFNIIFAVILLGSLAGSYEMNLAKDSIYALVIFIGSLFLQSLVLMGLLVFAKLFKESPDYAAFFYSAVINAAIGTVLAFLVVHGLMDLADGAKFAFPAIFFIGFLCYYSSCFGLGLLVNYVAERRQKK